MRQILFVMMLLLATTSQVELVAQKSTDTGKEWRKYVKEKRKAEKKAKKTQRKRDKIARKEAAKSRSAKRKADHKRWEKERAARKSKTKHAGRASRSSQDSRSSKIKSKRASERPTKARPSMSRSAVVKEAMKYRGSKYRYGGESPSRGFDCSGFVQYVYRKKGTQLPRTAAQQSSQGKSVRKSDLREGDLLFFSFGGKINHVGIVVSKKGEDLTMIHSGSSTGVVVTEVNKSEYWKKRWKKSRRVQ